LGAEPDNCEINPLRVFVTKNWILIDRDDGSNTLFNWFVPHAVLELRDNYIVNMDKWSGSNTNKSAITNFNLNNKICRNRAACGLAKDQLPVP
jgi:hypothetical protein